GRGVGHGDWCWRKRPDDQKADAELTENAHVVPLPHPRKLARKPPIVTPLRRQKTALCPPAASRRPVRRFIRPARDDDAPHAFRRRCPANPAWPPCRR